MYNDIKYFNYTRRRTMKYLLSLYIVSYKTIYISMYKRNVCCHCIPFYIMKNKYCNYTSSCIMTTNIFTYQEINIVIIYLLI